MKIDDMISGLKILRGRDRASTVTSYYSDCVAVWPSRPGMLDRDKFTMEELEVLAALGLTFNRIEDDGFDGFWISDAD